MLSYSLHWKSSLAKVPGLKLHVLLLALVWGTGGQMSKTKQILHALLLMRVRGITVFPCLLLVRGRIGTAQETLRECSDRRYLKPLFE